MERSTAIKLLGGTAAVAALLRIPGEDANTGPSFYADFSQATLGPARFAVLSPSGQWRDYATQVLEKDWVKEHLWSKPVARLTLDPAPPGLAEAKVIELWQKSRTLYRKVS